MPGGSELEVKLAITDIRLFDLIATDPEIRAMTVGDGPVTRSFEALYYDTPGFSLQQNGFAYRVRHEGENWVATAKSDLGNSGGFFLREEWNETVAGPEPSQTPFAGTNAGDRLATVIGKEKLQLLFSTRFMRTTLLLQAAGGTEVELALDRGTIWSGLEGSPIGELELELKKGSVSDLLQLSGWIASRWHLLPEVRSKYARGLELLQSNRQGSPSIYPEKIRQEISYPTLIALVNACVTEIFAFQSNLLVRKAAPDSVRELRIQCRRLRSLLKFFQPTLAKDAGKSHVDPLRQWGTLLGNIRDIDVLINAWEKFVVHFDPVFSSPGHWLIVLKERRDFLAEDISNRIRQGDLTRNIFEMQAWLYREEEKGSSIEQEHEADLLVSKLLIQSIKTLREDIQEIEGIAEIKILHQFRIRVKRLRYIQEALNSIARYQDLEFTASLKKIQDHIGKIHDAYQIKKLLDQFDASSTDERFLLEKELLISWRNYNTYENLSSLSAATEVFRRSAKLRLRSLSALRTNRGAKTRHNSGAHEPGE